jgi:serine protease AprX
MEKTILFPHQKNSFMKSLRLFTPFLALATLTSAQNAKLSTELQSIDPATQVHVIVQYDHVPTTTDHQRVVSLGGAFVSHLGVVASGAYAVPASMLASVANIPGVTHVSVDHPIQSHLDYSTAVTNATVAHSWGATGVGVGVAVIDSGIAANADFGSRVVYTKDFTGGTGQDLYGHGTHVAGIIGGNGANAHCSTCTRSSAELAGAGSIRSVDG